MGRCGVAESRAAGCLWRTTHCTIWIRRTSLPVCHAAFIRSHIHADAIAPHSVYEPTSRLVTLTVGFVLWRSQFQTTLSGASGARKSSRNRTERVEQKLVESGCGAILHILDGSAHHTHSRQVSTRWWSSLWSAVISDVRNSH